jgi:radical SAM superfamily enzyme YgiQ (UPF0313 family)
VSLVPLPPVTPRRSAPLEICLVSVPTATDFDQPEHFDAKGVRAIATDLPLGVLTLAAVLERDGVSPQVVDSNLWYLEYLLTGPRRRDIDFSLIAAERLAETGADVFGFSTICNSYPVTLLMAERLKALRPNAIVLFGGPQASVVDVATLAHFPFVDFVLRGEADLTVPEFVRGLSEGHSPEGVPGLTYRRGTEVRRNPDPPVLTDLDSLPLPAFHLHPSSRESHTIPLELGRGCPFACTFCSTNDFFRRRFRLKSPARLITEMDELMGRYPVSFFDLMHDMFTVDRKRVVAFCEALLATGRKYPWGCSARSDCVDRELIELMARAGCTAIFFGIESGSPRMQKIFDKGLDIEEAARNGALCCRAGMRTTLSTIIGFPEETKEDLRQTVGFLAGALRERNAMPQLHLLAPLPATPLHRKHEHELILEDTYCDMAYAGWMQPSTERELVSAYRDVFPNYYTVPMQYLERRYLHELREFLLRAFRRFRWLMAALHQEGEDLLTLYDEWLAWSGDLPARRNAGDLRRYYGSWEFDRQFVQFLRGRPAGQFSSVLLAFENAFLRVSRPPRAGEFDGAREDVLENDVFLGLEPHVHVLRLDGDVNRAVQLLETGRPADDSIFRPTVVATRLVTAEEVEVNEVPPLLEELLRLCDGASTVEKVLERFAPLCQPVGRLSAWDVAEYALASAYEKKLIQGRPMARPTTNSTAAA